VKIPVPLGRLAYRFAYAGLLVWSHVFRPHTRGVKCIVCAGDEVLLVRHSYGSGDWDLPGGFVRRGEAYADAARRELAEELGARGATSFEDLGEVVQRLHGRSDTMHGIRVELPLRDVSPQSFELRDARWFRRDALPAPRRDVVDRILALDTRFAGPAGG
jgi:ADP-ribose pyrophosphatase YjhB (NUDIX family)